MEISDVAQAVRQRRIYETSVPCEGECGRAVPYDSVHRVETQDGNEHGLCVVCCPNCFGGEGHGPS